LLGLFARVPPEHPARGVGGGKHSLGPGLLYISELTCVRSPCALIYPRTERWCPSENVLREDAQFADHRARGFGSRRGGQRLPLLRPLLAQPQDPHGALLGPHVNNRGHEECSHEDHRREDGPRRYGGADTARNYPRGDDHSYSYSKCNRLSLSIERTLGHYCLALFTEVRGRGQPVEKVVIGPVGSLEPQLNT
jgi:hypothetical protein